MFLFSLIRWPRIPDVLPCNSSVIESFNPFKYQFKDTSKVCPIECEYYGYSMAVSSDQYPTRNYAKLMMATKLDQLKELLQTENVTYEMIKNNFASVYIKFENLAVTEKIEQQAVTFVNLISNIGGTVGLFIGISVLSVMEFFEFGILTSLIYYRVHFTNFVFRK